jgi:hypothetical protein
LTIEPICRKEFGDMFFAIAKIRLESGEETFASFEEAKYRAIKDKNATIEAIVSHQVFEGPHFDGHSAFEPDPNSILMLSPNPALMHGQTFDYMWSQYGSTPTPTKPQGSNRLMRLLQAVLGSGNH